jgi:biopolymer transport protein ExbB
MAATRRLTMRRLTTRRPAWPFDLSRFVRVGARTALVALAAFVVAAILSTGAKAWWNDDWSMHKKITIDASATGANITDPIGTTPVLIRLHAGNMRFEGAKDDGADLRFIAGDDKTPLKYHIEKYDSLLAEALIWVAVPDLQPGAKSEIWLYWGNKKAVAANDAKGTYDPDTQLVYHFAERGTPALDSTAWANNAQSIGLADDGALIGGGLRLDGNTTLALPASPSLALAENGSLTWSIWAKPSAPQANAVLYARRDGANALLIGFDNGVPFVEVTNGGATQRSAAGAAPATNAWHHLAVVASGGTVTLYVDGAAYATLNAGLPALNSVATLGADPADAPAPAAAPTPTPTADAATPAASGETPATAPVPAATTAGFVGEVDELEIAKVARPAGFIRLAAIGQGPDPAKLIAFGGDEETASWLSGYFAVILKSVTLDGWVVIGVLLVMAAVSWVVMVDKAAFLRRQAKANALFRRGFREVAGDLESLDHADVESIASFGGRLDAKQLKVLGASSLYHIYRIGAAEIAHRVRRHGGRATALSSPAIAAIRATLDAGVVRETQRLNRAMVILTIAISGGPFLGLLGTVVGVMITFAAIAASGDVNVNAIAPGIAAALVATVAGLGVAIPALFGYNYLISKIKDLTNDIQVFVDEFITKTAEFHSSERLDSVDEPLAAE